MTTPTDELNSSGLFTRFLKNTPEILEAPRSEMNYQDQLQFLMDQCFPGALGLRVQALGIEECSASFAFRRETAGVHGLMHGGAIFSAGSTLAGIMTMLHGDESSKNLITTDSSIRYLRPVSEGVIRVVCKIRERKAETILLQCDFFNENNKRVARSRYTYMLLSA